MLSELRQCPSCFGDLRNTLAQTSFARKTGKNLNPPRWPYLHNDHYAEENLNSDLALYSTESHEHVDYRLEFQIAGFRNLVQKDLSL